MVLYENAILALADEEDGRILTKVVDDAERVKVLVEDNGPGLPTELSDALFEPFVTGRKRDGPRTGTGLGLAIAKRRVERHHGKISAGSSSSLGGASFTITLPKEQEMLGPARRSQPPHDEETP